MLHGWCDVSASFQFLVDALKRDWRVIAPDWRGFGLSQGNGDAYWFPDYLADLDFLLDHYVGTDPVRLIGHSMGGNVASLYAGVRPRRIVGIVNLEGFGLKPVDSEAAPDRYVKWLDQMREAAGFRVYPDRAAFAQRLRQDNPRLSHERAAFLAEYLGERVGEGVRLAADPCHRWANPVLYRIEEAQACWRRVTAPVLWVRGGDSDFMRHNHPDEADYLARLGCFTNASEIKLENCGHNMHHDQPERVAALIEEFFA